MSLSNSGKPVPVAKGCDKQFGGETIITLGGFVLGTELPGAVGRYLAVVIKDRIALTVSCGLRLGSAKVSFVLSAKITRSNGAA